MMKKVTKDTYLKTNIEYVCSTDKNFKAIMD